MKNQNQFDYPLFALGFRPFFGLAGLSGLILILLWNLIYRASWGSENYFTPIYWHAHEMLLGYTSAVIAGFLLTAVGNWTGHVILRGGKLAGLCLLWLYGRILPFYAGQLPVVLIALTDMAFLPLLAYIVTKPVIAAKQYHNLIFTVLLLLLMTGNALIHCEMLGLKEKVAETGLQLTVAAITVLILVIAGRVFPFFTERGLPGTLAIRNPQLDNGAILSAVLVFGLQIYGISGFFLAAASVLACLVNYVRIAGWHTQKIWYVPLLWVLYTGYGWIILGFALTGLTAYGWVQSSIALHAFTLGGIGVLTLGMMARVALGHTGRRLLAPNTIAIGFVTINLAAFIRIFLPVILPDWYEVVIYTSSMAWLMAFLLFLFEYGPILTGPRADGKEG